MTEQNQLATIGGTTAMTEFDDAAVMAALGIDVSVMETDAAITAAEPQFARVYKVDTLGKTVMKDNRMGQFQPVRPGETKARELVDSAMVLPLGVRFWPQKSEEETVEKDGKQETKLKTVCEGARRPILDENNKPILDDQGQIMWMKDSKGEDVGYVTDPGFGMKKTMERYDMYGSKFGRCLDCPYLADKSCKLRGALEAANVKHDGEDVMPYVGIYMLNYTSTINWKKMLDDVNKRKAEFGTIDPMKLVLKVFLQLNESGVKPFYEHNYTPIMPQAKIDSKKVAAIKKAAIEKYLADKERVKQQRAEAGTTTTTAVAPAAPAADGLPSF